MNPVTKKQIVILVIIIAIDTGLYIAGSNLLSLATPKEESNQTSTDPNTTSTIPSFTPPILPSLGIPPISDATLAREAWSIFEQYLTYAKAHDLAGVKRLSHQLSLTCADPTKSAECFTLMDSVYNIGSTFEAGLFKNVASDSRQIIIFTDGPEVAFIYFTRDGKKNLKLLGIRLCMDVESSLETCVEGNVDKKDDDNDGWWNSVESLFY